MFPAHAGMNRLLASFVAFDKRVPRPRGDEPLFRMIAAVRRLCSPPTRG